MAQLTDDCFAFGGPMLGVDEAVAMIAERVAPIKDIVSVHLFEADGRVLARDVIAAMPLPPFTNSAVDGYAIRNADIPVSANTSFRIAGRVQAGGASDVILREGDAVRIFTGAPMPRGTGTVFMQEDVQLVEEGHVLLPPGLKPGANVRPAGEDIAAGQLALPAGRLLRPQDVALLAAQGQTEVPVKRKLRVAVFSTGNEVVSPGTERGNSQLFDSNRFMLAAMLRRKGCLVSDLGILADRQEAVLVALRNAAASHDLLLTSGGVSAGEEDHVKAAVENVGTLVLWRMAIKPGRPVAMGVIEGTPFIGLPGNPVASFVTFVNVVAPTVAALLGTPHMRPRSVPVRAAFSYAKKAGRREYVRARLRPCDDGSLEATKFSREGAGLLSSLVDTDGLIELGEEVTAVTPGQAVNFIGYDAVL